MKWYYEKDGFTREEAEQRILALNFKSVNRGWAIDFKDKTKRRLHIVPSIDSMLIHQDVVVEGGQHSISNSRKAILRCQIILKKLRHRTFREKVKYYYQKLSTFI